MSTFFMTALEAPVGSEDEGAPAGVDMVVVLAVCRSVYGACDGYDGGKGRTMRRECR